MFKVLIIFFILNFYSHVYSSTKDEIISKIKLTNNLSFDFIQTIDDKNENGNCIIKYPKKIWCEYNNNNKKIIVSNGKSLVIKNQNNGSYYIYRLRKTPLEFLLDKEYLISKMNTQEPKEIDNKYLNFKFFENNNEINIFFDKTDLNLIGWQTEDVYQNLVITFISSIKINQKIDNKIFILPKNN
jgi:outer membrane lipoprotein-sorting protein